MVDALSLVLVALAGLVALGALVLVIMGKLVNWTVLIGAAVTELVALVQLVAGLVQLAGTDRDVSAGSFVGYLVAAVLVLPIGAFWALTERSRWGPGVLAIAAIVLPILVLRLDQIWSGG